MMRSLLGQRHFWQMCPIPLLLSHEKILISIILVLLETRLISFLMDWDIHHTVLTSVAIGEMYFQHRRKNMLGRLPVIFSIMSPRVSVPWRKQNKVSASTKASKTKVWKKKDEKEFRWKRSYNIAANNCQSRKVYEIRDCKRENKIGKKRRGKYEDNEKWKQAKRWLARVAYFMKI